MVLLSKVPVPVVIPGSQDADEPGERKSSLPAQSSVEGDEGDKGKGKPVSHGKCCMLDLLLTWTLKGSIAIH